MAGGGPPTGTRARGEALVGLVMVAVVFVGALYFRWRPEAVFLDRWGFSLVHAEPHDPGWLHVADLRAVTIIGASSVLSAVVVVSRDRWRALVCLVAPVAAYVLTEYLLKPVIARRYEAVLTYPSGTTAVVSAAATAWVVAVPRSIRAPVAALAAFVVGLECMAVVALQWHYPTDAVAGAVLGAGVVLLADGLLHRVTGPVRATGTGRRTVPRW